MGRGKSETGLELLVKRGHRPVAETVDIYYSKDEMTLWGELVEIKHLCQKFVEWVSLTS